MLRPGVDSKLKGIDLESTPPLRGLEYITGVDSSIDPGPSFKALESTPPLPDMILYTWSRLHLFDSVF